jgi:glutamine synthetase
MNPYYALSAVFLLGLRGIEKKLKLQTPPISHFSPEDRKSGKVWMTLSGVLIMILFAQVKMLPISLESATARMMRPESIARESGMLGDVFVEHFGGTREHEVKLWNEAVTNWEGMFNVLPVRTSFDCCLQSSVTSSWHK